MYRLVRPRDRARGPTVVVVQVPGTSVSLRHQISALHDFPCVDIAPRSSDSAYPTLGWQSPATNLAVQRLLLAGPWLTVRNGMEVCTSAS